MSKAFFLPISGRTYTKQRADASKKGAVGYPGSQPCCNQFRGLNMYRNTLVCETRTSVTSSEFELAATVDGGNIWTSADSGATWTEDTSVGSPKSWGCITSSLNGVKLAAGVTYGGGGNIWTSTDSGANWFSKASTQQWSAITSSSDGVKLAAPVYNGNIWTSSDSGASWTEDLSVGFAKDWWSIASSSDGDKLAAVIGYGTAGRVWTSTGLGWSEQPGSPSRLWGGIASSSDGVKLAAAVGGIGVASGLIWTSIDSGVNWLSYASSQPWSCIASSSDGIKLAAAVYNGNIWTSTDSGVNWTEDASVGSPLLWVSIASSSDGTKLAAVPGGLSGTGNVWISTNSGGLWHEVSVLGGPKYWTSITLSEPTEEITSECPTTIEVYKDNLSQCPPELCYSPVAKSVLNKTVDGSTTVDLSYNRTTRQLLQSRCMSFASNTSTCAHSVSGSTRGSCCNQSCNQVVYKPSNTSFDTQGAVPSGNRIALLKYNALVQTPGGQYLRSNYTSDPKGKKAFPCTTNLHALRQRTLSCPPPPPPPPPPSYTEATWHFHQVSFIDCGVGVFCGIQVPYELSDGTPVGGLSGIASNYHPSKLPGALDTIYYHENQEDILWVTVTMTITYKPSNVASGDVTISLPSSPAHMSNTVFSIAFDPSFTTTPQADTTVWSFGIPRATYPTVAASMLSPTVMELQYDVQFVRRYTWLEVEWVPPPQGVNIQTTIVATTDVKPPGTPLNGAYYTITV